MEASARHYFSKSAKDLTVAEAALMAGTTNAPSAYDPVTQPELAKNRMDWVLTKMLEEKFITKAQYDQAVATPIASMLHVSESPAGCGAAGSAAYFCSYVVNEVLSSENFGPDVASRRQLLTRGGLKITTTLNLQRQSAADNVIQSNVPTGDASGTDTTIASIEPGTGRIQALAQNSNYGDGGPDSSDTQLVYAADAKHGGIELSDGTVGFQPGSTFKALILAEWFKEGNPAGAGLSAVPRTFQWNIPCAPENNDPTWAPKNVDPSLNRSTNVTEATKMSINVAYAEMLSRMDVCAVTNFASSIGVTKADGTPLDARPSIVLGSQNVPPLSMANAYATFASGGKYCKPIAIDRILDASGTSMAVPSADCTQAMDQGAADLTASTLTATSQRGGTAQQAVFGRPIGGKTGTTDDNNDAWFVGFTPQLATAVWIGHAGSPRTLNYQQIGPHYVDVMYGNTIAVPMWRDYMSQAVGNDPVLPIPSHG